MILLHFSDSTKCLKAHFDCDDFSCPVIPVPVIICLCPQTSRQKKCSRYNPLDFSHGRFCDTSGNSKRSLILQQILFEQLLCQKSNRRTTGVCIYSATKQTVSIQKSVKNSCRELQSDFMLHMARVIFHKTAGHGKAI